MTGIDEKKIELFVVFQEKLGVLVNDRTFREEFFEPLLYSGITDESLDKIIEYIIEDEEVKQISSEIKDDVKQDLMTLLKKLIERFTKFKTEPNNDYIG